MSKDFIYLIISSIFSKLDLVASNINRTKSLSRIALDACLNVLLVSRLVDPKIPGVSKKINCLLLKGNMAIFLL